MLKREGLTVYGIPRFTLLASMILQVCSENKLDCSALKSATYKINKNIYWTIWMPCASEDQGHKGKPDKCRTDGPTLYVPQLSVH